jgi:hypothetical protein
MKVSVGSFDLKQFSDLLTFNLSGYIHNSWWLAMKSRYGLNYRMAMLDGKYICHKDILMSKHRIDLFRIKCHFYYETTDLSS